jgi:hypothetical protein
LEEDILISIFVEKYGTKKWDLIENELRERIPGRNKS